MAIYTSCRMKDIIQCDICVSEERLHCVLIERPFCALDERLLCVSDERFLCFASLLDYF
jgi:hypothetical protein